MSILSESVSTLHAASPPALREYEPAVDEAVEEVPAIKKSIIVSLASTVS